jgi:glucokinase
VTSADATSPSTRAGYAVGIDLGGTNLKLVAVTGAGEELFRATESTPQSLDGWREAIRARLEALAAELGEPPTRVGVAAPGLVAPDGRSIAWMRGRLEALQGVDWTTFLNAGCPVPVLNDGHAALLAEAWRGAAAGRRNVVLLTLGTGVGGGALVDGRLLTGHIGRAGHLGHIALDADGPPDIVGTPGSLEDAIGECTIAARSGGRFRTTEALVRAYRDGDGGAAELWLRAVRRLACGIASLINVLDPEVVVLGGGITRAGQDLFAPLARFLDSLEWRPLGAATPVLPAALGEYAGAIGAARHAITSNAP